MRIKSQWVGVELDPTFAQIARLLYPEAQIYAQGFEKVSLSDSSFDKSDRQILRLLCKNMGKILSFC